MNDGAFAVRGRDLAPSHAVHPAHGQPQGFRALQHIAEVRESCTCTNGFPIASLGCAGRKRSSVICIQPPSSTCVQEYWLDESEAVWGKCAAPLVACRQGRRRCHGLHLQQPVGAMNIAASCPVSGVCAGQWRCGPRHGAGPGEDDARSSRLGRSAGTWCVVTER